RAKLAHWGTSGSAQGLPNSSSGDFRELTNTQSTGRMTMKDQSMRSTWNASHPTRPRPRPAPSPRHQPFIPRRSVLNILPPHPTERHYGDDENQEEKEGPQGARVPEVRVLKGLLVNVQADGLGVPARAASGHE